MIMSMIESSFESFDVAIEIVCFLCCTKKQLQCRNSKLDEIFNIKTTQSAKIVDGRDPRNVQLINFESLWISHHFAITKFLKIPQISINFPLIFSSSLISNSIFSSYTSNLIKQTFFLN